MRQDGFTLIEILITIALVAIISLVAVPITSEWLRDSEVQVAEGQLTQAIGHAQASGIRNVPASTGDDHAAIICINTTTDALTVRESTSSVTADCTAANTATVLWQAKLESRVELVDTSDNAVSCLCFNNKGLLTDQGSSCSSCFTGNDLKITSGSASTDFSIY